MASSQTPNLDSKKRSATPPSLPPTRSKSPIYISSYGFYSLRRRNLLAETNETAKLRSIDEIPTRKRRRMRDPMQDSAVSNPRPCVLVKDLRTRRVFSPGCQLSIDGDEEKEKETGSAKGNQGFEDGLGNFGDNAGEKGDVLESDDMKVESVDFVVDLNVESPQATPPDAEIFGYRDEDGGNKVECVTEKTENKKNDGLLDCSDKEKENNSGMKLIASPPSRVKLFKTPGSFSYKRLLPFLMDMAKDDSCNSSPVQGAQKKDNCNVGDQQISGRKCITNSFSLDDRACVSRIHSQDAPVSGNYPSDATYSYLTPVQPLNYSSMTLCSSKDISEGVEECCSDAVVIEENEKTDAGSCFDSKNLNHSNSNLSSGAEDSSLNDCSIDGRLVDRRENEISDGDIPRSAQNGDDEGMSLIMEKNQSGVDDKVGQKDHELKTHAGDAKLFDAEDQCKAPNLNDTKSLNLSSTEGGTLDGIEYSNTQLTASDAKVSDKALAFEDVDSRIKKVSQSAGQILRNSLNGNIRTNNDYCISDKRMDSSSKSKLGLNPCSRVKLFKNPSSFSYRRLLPYLMDITKQDSGAFENGHSVKLDKRVQESLLSEPSTSSESFLVGDDTNVSHTPQKAALAASTGASSDEQQNQMSPEQNSETPTPSASNRQQESQVVEAISDQGSALEVSLDIFSITNGSSSPTVPLSSDLNLVSSPGANATLVSRETLVDNGGGCTSPAVKLLPVEEPVEVGSLSQNSTGLHASVPLGIPVDVSRKSILKRNPRGCRGSCTCLNCTSFRLHAERAFEFSKNQMQDAEEVALDLIKELSQLRSVLEKLSYCPDDHINSISQVKEACRKASEAEELAKNRLTEMNYDLNIHCRTPCGDRPRVRFADNVEERLVPKMT